MVAKLRPFLPAWTDQQLQDRLESLGTCSETAMIENYHGLNAEDVFPFWSKSTIPSLLIYGQESLVLPESVVGELREINPVPKIVGIPKAGHMIQWDNLPDSWRRYDNSLNKATDKAGQRHAAGES